MGKKKSRKKKNNRKSLTSNLTDHKQQGKKLIPPLLNMPAPIKFSSWANERLPEMIWAVLLFEYLSPQGVFNSVRKAMIILREDFMKNKTAEAAPPDATLTYLASISDDVFASFLSQLISVPNAKEILSSLCVFDDLPGIERWRNHLGCSEKIDNWEQTLSNAVLNSFDHQSENATHCRWLRVILVSICGKLFFSENMTGKINELCSYPEQADLTKIRPSIRSLELTLSVASAKYIDDAWAKHFWKFCFENTQCTFFDPETIKQRYIDEKEVDKIYMTLQEHFFSTITNTDVNPQSDALFGIVFYGISLAKEIAAMPAELASLGRIAIRTLTELLITHKYLTIKNDLELYKAYRSYGCGQAKLMLLKLRDGMEQPDFISREKLELLCNEDYWEEFQEINIGNWATTNLRKMAEDSECKDIYDQYYNMTSSYVHGHWCAVRDSNFTVCLNPLHRFHRIPGINSNTDSGTIPDVVNLVNKLIDSLVETYPGFDLRLCYEE
ncbi:DUF5677 domain-containing protein [Desulfovibrio sp.]|uniref:DUF5677 domain-containing protein n=1 Tax=Desulfovibrio sp. TaxID=885 RepID=UPI0025C6E3A6|nr:DUF5677 domain-containing protein [Desulfovibrio sp.]